MPIKVFFGFLLAILAFHLSAQSITWSNGDKDKNDNEQADHKARKFSVDSMEAALSLATDSVQKKKIRNTLRGEYTDEASEKYEAKQYEESALLYEKAFEISPKKDAHSAYNAACSRALKGDTAKALADLEKAVDLGWSDVAKIKTDKDLFSLHQQKEWFAILAKFQTKEKIRTYLKGIFLGIMFILFLNYLFLFFSVKDNSLLYYSLFLLFGALTQINTVPDAGTYVVSLLPWLKSFLPNFDSAVFYTSMMMLFYLLFTRSFLELKDKFKKKDKWMKFFIVYSIINILLSLIGHGWSVAGSVYLFTFIISLTCLKKGNRQVRYFVLANSIYCLAYVLALVVAIVSLVKSGQNSFQDFTLVPDMIGLIASATLLSFVMGSRINALKTEKILAQEKALVVLEERVEERTAEVVKEKNEVVRQKYLVEEKQHEIVDSITYARRIQQAILPPLNQMKQHFPESFLLYLPKDIVAGDFYWMYAKDDTILIAAADCTGHGVPGALVSVVCSNALNRAVKEYGISETGPLLDKVSDLVMETFEKSGEEINDGMDISLLRIRKGSRYIGGGKIEEAGLRRKEGEEGIEVQWSGANNPLWIIKDQELREIKADKQPIGKSKERKPFTSHMINVTGGETFYLITDGYADQFSAEDKKLMKKEFKTLLLSVQDRTMGEQKQVLETRHNQWKSGMEQTDDVTVIGLRL